MLEWTLAPGLAEVGLPLSISLPNQTRVLVEPLGGEGRFGVIGRCGKEVVSVPVRTGDKIPSSGLFLGENVFAWDSSPSVTSGLVIGTGRYAPIEICLSSLWRIPSVDTVEISAADHRYALELIRDIGLSDSVRAME